MRHASLFSGIGGPEVAAAMLGWENLFHCEINPFGRKVLEYWFPDSVSYEDITKTSFKEWRGKVDVLSGGFPCQPFSYAGKRGGAEDARYLWPEMLRAIDEIRPAWVVGENVAGLSTMVEGWLPTEVGRGAALFEEGDFRHDWIVEQTFTIERIARDLEGLGYSVQPVLVPAAACGAPHRRDRIFILASIADTADAGAKAQRKREDALPGAGVTADAKRDGLQYDLERGGEGGLLEEESAGGKSRLSNEIQLAPAKGARDASPDADGAGREESAQQERETDSQKAGARLYDRVERPRGKRNASDALRQDIQGRDYQAPGGQWKIASGSIGFAGRAGVSPNSIREGLEREDKPGAGEGGERLRIRGNFARYNREDLLPGNRWRDFPTVSPIHRGNDGLPFRMDRASISFGKWRTESLKAYGNAIVPQVMYRIFEAIEKVSK